MMPLNLGNDGDGSSRIILTEPRGSTAEVCSFFHLFSSLLASSSLFPPLFEGLELQS